MLLEGYKQVREEIDISAKNIINAYISIVCKHFDIKPGEYIANGNLCYLEEYHTSHSWDEEKVIRPATSNDILAIAHIEMAKELLKNGRD